jgi:tRNA-specific 2-thiouridylase
LPPRGNSACNHPFLPNESKHRIPPGRTSRLQTLQEILPQRGGRQLRGLQKTPRKIAEKSGKILGQHKGYPFYTIGQRKGLDIALGRPVYVTNILPESNTVVLGEEDDLIQSTMMVGGINWQKYDSLSNPTEAVTKIRYKDEGTLSLLKPESEQTVTVEFMGQAKGIAPGQSAVFYEEEDVIGGGIIQRNTLLEL